MKSSDIPEKFKGLQRKEVPNINDILMAQAITWALMSKDPSTQVGAAIYSTDNRVLSCGYNGTPVGWADEDFPWGKGYEGEDKKYEKYSYVVHAEDNAVRNFKKYNPNVECLKGATIYVTLFPCSNCAKIIVEAGIKKIVYLHDFYANTPDVINSKKYLKDNGVEFFQYESVNVDSVKLSLDRNIPTEIEWKKGNTRKRK